MMAACLVAIDRIASFDQAILLLVVASVFIAAPLDLSIDVRAHLGLEVKRPRLEGGEVLREYGLGAQVLRALGLRRVRLLTNRPRKIVGVEGYGLEIVDQISESEAVTSIFAVRCPSQLLSLP